MVDQQALTEAASRYARYIRAKRDLLQTLFYASRNSGDEAWSRHLRLKHAEQSGDARSRSLRAGWAEEQEAYEHAAQDAASALMLIVDYARREAFTPEELESKARSLGLKLQHGASNAGAAEPVELNRAIWALANQARHVHQWKRRSEDDLLSDSKSKCSVSIIKRLGYDPRDLRAARELIGRNGIVQSYIEFEEMLLETVYEIQRGPVP
jgi:hypothetical protein